MAQVLGGLYLAVESQTVHDDDENSLNDLFEKKRINQIFSSKQNEDGYSIS